MTAVRGEDVLYRGGLSARAFARGDGPTEQVLAGTLAWRSHLASKLGAVLRAPLDWPEDPHAEGERLVLPPRALDALRLLAVYADRTELELPDALPGVMDLDPVWQRARQQDFKQSRFAHVLAADCWLPAEFEATVAHAYPDGTPAVFGSGDALRFQLRELNRCTLQLDLAEIREWLQDPVAEPDLWRLAGTALAALHELRNLRTPAMPLLLEG